MDIGILAPPGMHAAPGDSSCIVHSLYPGILPKCESDEMSLLTDGGGGRGGGDGLTVFLVFQKAAASAGGEEPFLAFLAELAHGGVVPELFQAVLTHITDPLYPTGIGIALAPYEERVPGITALEMA